MLHNHQTDCESHMHVCPRSGRKRLPGWLFPLMGVASFIWFLIRVLPKPSRAAYPCQRVAAPLAASFVVWVTGLLATAFAYRKWHSAFVRHRRAASVLCAGIALIAGLLTVANMPRSARAAYPSFHDPIGVARGIHPGRVVWVHNPGATNWAGYTSSERWYEDTRTDPVVVERMVSQAVRGVSGEQTDATAWSAIFRHYNQTHGRGDRGYYAGEKITIKLNLVDCNIAVNAVNLTSWDKVNTNTERNKIAVAPQMIRGLLKHLVYTVGVNQSDITLTDTSAYWPNQYLTQIRAEYPNVKFEQNGYGYTSAPYRTKATFSSSPFGWSTADANGKLQDYLPNSYAQADYLINFTTLKGHSAGITLCGKNDYGSLIRLPNGKLDNVAQNFYNLHYSLPNNYTGWSPGVGKYRAIVDLMGHPGMGGKTLLYMIDGLYGGYYSESVPYKWNMVPFNGDWPSSLFVSQDGVAIDSVGYDFLNTEWPNIVSGGTQWVGSLEGGAEDYLHEAALANNPPSGMFYDPDKNGVRMTSLGVHEHWNNPIDKQYSRNRGFSTGIELVSLTYDNGSIQRSKLEANSTAVVVTGAVITAAFTDYFYVESDDRAFGLRVNRTAHGYSLGNRVNVSGTIGTTADGERYIAATKITAAGSGSIKPVHVSNRDLGGGNWNYNAGTGAGQAGIAGASGLNNIGLLVRVSGRVTEIDSNSPATWFKVDDGSGVGVKCVVPSGVTINPGWQVVGVTGVSSCSKSGTDLSRLIRVRRQIDVRSF